MPTPPDDPLRKVTLNLYAADCEWLEHQYGRGWTERIRQHIHQYVHTQTAHTPEVMYHKVRRTLGDLG
jgi:hypothetical protein